MMVPKVPALRAVPGLVTPVPLPLSVEYANDSGSLAGSNAGQPDAATLPVPPGATKDQVALGERIFHGEVDACAVFAKAVDLLKGVGLAPVDWPCSGGENTRLAAMRGKLLQYDLQLLLKRGEA